MHKNGNVLDIIKKIFMRHLRCHQKKEENQRKASKILKHVHT